VKLSLQGKVVGRFGKRGEGPGEIPGLPGVNKFKDNIALTDKFKVIICNKDLKYLREIRIGKRFHNLILSRENKVYFYNNPSYSNHYFSVYTKDFKYLKKFGIKKPGAKEEKPDFKNYRLSHDRVKQTLYVPEENGIWVSFVDRYDLRYYKDEKVVVDIKSKSQMYSTADDVFSGVKVKNYTDYSLHIAKDKNKLYYFYVIEKKLFCDVFDLSENYLLILRLKSPLLYYPIVHYKGSTFYGFQYDEESESKVLTKIQIN
jgi:hypothetical protein